MLRKSERPLNELTCPPHPHPNPKALDAGGTAVVADRDALTPESMKPLEGCSQN
jgi:hypothetical protein